MEGKYWKRVRSRAWRDTLEAFGIATWQRAMTKVLAALLGIALIGYFGGADDAKSKILLSLQALGASSFMFLLFYFWNFFLVPGKLDS
jgi:hypothetical protein